MQLAALALVVLLLVGCSEDGGVPYSVAGRVVDSSGTGIPGVELAFSGDFGIAETDSAGQWQKVGLLGTVRITPYKAGWVFAARTVSGEDEGVVFVGHRVGTEEVVQIATADNHFFRYRDTMYPSGLLYPVSFPANGLIKVEVARAFAEYPERTGIYGVLHASEQVTVVPEIQGALVEDKRIDGQGVLEFSFEGATALWVVGTGGTVNLYAFPVPFFHWDNRGTAKMQLPVELVTKTRGGRYNGFIVTQAPHAYVHQEQIPYEETVYKHVCPLKPLSGDYRQFNHPFLPAVHTVHFVSELPVVIQCSAPRLEDYQEEWIYSAQFRKELGEQDYEFWVMADDRSSQAATVRQVLKTSMEHAAQYLPTSVQLDRVIVFGLRGVGRELGHSHAVSDYIDEEHAFAHHIALAMENWSRESKDWITELVAHEFGHIIHASCYACGSIIPYSWFSEGFAQIFSSEVLKLCGYRPLGLSTVSAGYKYVADMEKHLYVDWSNWQGGNIEESAICVDDYEIGLNFMVYFKEVYGDDVLKRYFAAIAPKMLEQVMSYGIYGAVWSTTTSHVGIH